MEKDLTAIEIVGIAIVKEREAQDLYKRMSAEIKNPLVSEKFISLSREEKKHEQILSHLYLKMTGENQVKIPQIKGMIIKIELPKTDASLDELFTFAIKREREAQQLYVKGADAAVDENGRRTFRYLANFEHQHEVVLTAEFENYKRDSSWYAECPDIILEGP